MRKLLLASSLLALTTLAQAQTDFRPGYVVQPSGDTLRGQVDYRGAQRSVRIARFRSATESSATEYTPAQLRAYGFADGKSYQTETITLPASAPEAYFMEVVVLGPASLLSLRDKDDAEHLYLRKGTQAPQELAQRVEEVYSSTGTRYLQSSNEFRRTLAASMQDCPAVQPSLPKLRYSVGSIAAVVRRYNEYMGGATPTTLNRPGDENIFQLALILAGEANKLEIKQEASAGGAKKISAGVLPAVGLAAQIKLTRLNPHLAFHLGALYSPTASYEGTSEYKSATDIYRVERQMQVKLSSIRVPILLRYSFPAKHIQPFVQAGVSGNILLKTESRQRTRFIDRPSFPDYTAWRPLVEKPRKFEQGLVGGIGLNLAQASGRNLSAELRYERTNGFSDNIGTLTRVHRYSLVVGYSLLK